MNSSSVIIFDLDDTLYKELDYLISAFRFIDKYIAKNYKINSCFDIMYNAHISGINPFDALPQCITIKEFLDMYRLHLPDISLDKETATLLTLLHDKQYTLGIITDGRSISQRNKINALGLTKFIANDNIIISEEFGSSKTDMRNFKYFVDKYPQASQYTYIGDNPKKDFINANQLGWKTICLKDNGRNIHSQSVEIDAQNKPQHIISTISELINYI